MDWFDWLISTRFTGSGFKVQRIRVQGSRFSPVAGQKNGRSNRKRNYIFVINDEVSYERFKAKGSRPKAQRFRITFSL